MHNWLGHGYSNSAPGARRLWAGLFLLTGVPEETHRMSTPVASISQPFTAESKNS
jgi:hypothetical protein